MDTKRVIESYESGYGLGTVAQQFNTNVYQVKKILKESGVRIRNRQESNDIANRRRAKSVNHSYFKNWSSNSAYILGLLASDGYVREDRNLIKLTLSSIDREILEKIKIEMEIEKDIKTYQGELNGKSFENSTISFSSKEIKKDLAQLGIKNAKTFDVYMSDKIPSEYKIDFLRGYFDGDGCVDEIKNYKGDTQQIRFRIVSGSKKILSQFVELLFKDYKIPMVKVRYSEDKNYYSISYSTLSAIKIYELIYENNALYLQRKKDKFDQLIDNR